MRAITAASIEVSGFKNVMTAAFLDLDSVLAVTEFDLTAPVAAVDDLVVRRVSEDEAEVAVPLESDLEFEVDARDSDLSMLLDALDSDFDSDFSAFDSDLDSCCSDFDSDLDSALSELEDSLFVEEVDPDDALVGIG